MELNEWWKSSLSEEIHECLLSQETKLPIFSAQSPQLSARRCLVDWLAIVCDHYRVCRTARHLAVALLDYFMDRFVIVEEKLKLVGIGCLLVAAKFEDQEIKIPKSMELNQYVCPPGYGVSTYLKMELMILEQFDWKIGLPTAAHFAEYFTMGAIKEVKLCNKGSPDRTDQMQKYIEKYVNYFLEISLQDHAYRDYKPSKVCAACVASTRVCMKMKPDWPAALQKLTQYSWPELQPVINVMLQTHSVDEKSSQCGTGPHHQVSPVSDMSINSSPMSPPTPVTPANQLPVAYTATNQVPYTGTGPISYNYNPQQAWMMFVP